MRALAERMAHSGTEYIAVAPEEDPWVAAPLLLHTAPRAVVIHVAPKTKAHETAWRAAAARQGVEYVRCD